MSILAHLLHEEHESWSIYEVHANLVCISFQIWICTYMLESIPKLFNIGTSPRLLGFLTLSLKESVHMSG